jgi:hydroxymethylbilane synthase
VKALRIGSRGSALALWQASHVREELMRLFGQEAEIVRIHTAGDRDAESAIPLLGARGVFIKEIEDALLSGRVDLAVHSMKDVPTETSAALGFPAILKRGDVRDCLISRGGWKLAELPAGAVVGTSSLRRQAQLRRYRADLDVRNLRGNVDTRMRKVEEGEFDAVVIARAGVERLGATGKIAETLSTDIMLPAVGQGALCIEGRADDGDLARMVGALDDSETRACVTAERALLARLEGGCQVPLGALARMKGQQLMLEACVVALDGSESIRRIARGSLAAPEKLGIELAEELLGVGAGTLLEGARQNAPR